jgi:PAS domain S-box-containing protein
MNFYKEKLKKIRISKRWSQSGLAKELKVARSTISSWEHGKTFPSENYIRKIAEILCIDVFEIADIKKEYPVSGINFKEQAEILLKKICPLSEPAREIEKFGQYVSVLNKRITSTSIILQAFLSAIHTPTYIKDTKQEYIIVNEAFMKLLGLNLSSFLSGSTDFTFFNNTDAVNNLNMDRDVIKYGKQYIDREEYIPGSKKSRTGLISKYPIYDDTNKICGLIGVFVDITERKKTEEYLRVLDYALNQINDCIWIAKADGVKGNVPQLKYINNAIETLTEMKKDEMLSNPGKNEKIFSSYYQNIFKSLNPVAKYPIQKYYSIKRENKQDIPINEKIYYCGDNYFLGILHDNSKKEKKCHFKELLDIYDQVLDDGIFLYDEAGEFYFINKNNEKIFGYSDADFYKNGFKCWVNQCVHNKYKDDIFNIFHLKSKEKIIKYEIVCPDGHSKTIKSKFIFYRLIKGKKCFVQINTEII